MWARSDIICINGRSWWVSASAVVEGGAAASIDGILLSSYHRATTTMGSVPQKYNQGSCKHCQSQVRIFLFEFPMGFNGFQATWCALPEIRAAGEQKFLEALKVTMSF